MNVQPETEFAAEYGSDGEVDSSSNSQQCQGKCSSKADDRQASQLSANAGTTPAITKLRQSRTEFKVLSPSDQLFSPCTRKIEKCRLSGASTQPQLFRSRPPLLPPPPLGLGGAPSFGCATVGSFKMRNAGTAAPACTPQRLTWEEEEEGDDGMEQEQNQQLQPEKVDAPVPGEGWERERERTTSQK